jgi:hypothetical protein
MTAGRVTSPALPFKKRQLGTLGILIHFSITIRKNSSSREL